MRRECMEFHGNSPETSFDKIKARAVFSGTYRFFDIVIAIKSDKEEMLEYFRRLYKRFRVEDPDKKVHATYYIITQAPGGPLIVAEEGCRLKARALGDANFAAIYAYMLAFEYIFVNMKSHILLHGGAVSRNDEGFALIGSSGAGKTVLTLHLVLNRDFSFLSDDQVAIDRETYLMDPFPRGIGVRESALALFSGLKIDHLQPRINLSGERKWFVDISQISENDVGKPCRLKYLIFLANSLNEVEDEWRLFRLLVDESNDELLGQLRSLAREGEICHQRIRYFHALSFYLEEEAPSALEIDRLCQDCGVWLLDMREISTVKPDFSLKPEVQQISWQAAIVELLKVLQNDYRSNLGQAFLELAGLLDGVECYKLSVGKLDEMADHICHLASGLGSSDG
jgi:hypothetical protein